MLAAGIAALLGTTVITVAQFNPTWFQLPRLLPLLSFCWVSRTRVRELGARPTWRISPKATSGPTMWPSAILLSVSCCGLPA